MPITRIKSIKQIGRFKSYSGGGATPFCNVSDGKKMSVVLGDNTYGKSTLTDILRSVNSGNNVEIIRRRTIPNDTSIDQVVELSYQPPNAGTQNIIKYERGSWVNNMLQNKVLIFDQEFIHQNIFTGIHLTRDNKENFTDFILGEEGVKLGAEIEKRNMNAKKFPEDLRSVRPDYIRNEYDTKKVDQFINLKVSESRDSLAKIADTQAKLMERLNKISDFTRLSQVDLCDEKYITTLNTLSEFLQKVKNSSYDEVSKDALTQIQEQLQYVDSHWLEQGAKHLSDSRCPFCTQDTTPVESLINAYKIVFDHKYNSYVSEVHKDIDSIKTTLGSLSATSHSKKHSESIDVIKKYVPFIGEIEEFIKILDIKCKELQDSESSIRLYVEDSLREPLDAFIGDKKSNIHKPRSFPISLDDLQSLVISTDKISSELYDIIEKCSNIINLKKNEVSRWTPEIVASNLAKASNLKSDAEMKIKRLDQDNQCVTYKEKLEEQRAYKKATLELRSQLESEQSRYLSSLFSSINTWFKDLGSNDFTLDRSQSNRGNKTVYELKVAFCGEPISSDDLCKVFSESDRRNLALAIYLARAEQADKENTILVLDDPVVSFDDNRILVTCNRLAGLSNSFEQIIIMTHYKSVVRRLLKSRSGAVYVKIEKDTNGAKLEAFDTKDFQLSDHERAYIDLAAFINGDTNNYGGLRQFMERHISLIFQPQLINLGKTDAMLSEKISALADAKEIDTVTKNTLDGFRVTLNPDHHEDEGDTTIEDRRSLTRSVLEELYRL